MKVLADTNAFLWFITDSSRLSPEAKRILESPDTDRYLSIASVWEIAIKVSIGKLTLAEKLEHFLPEQLRINQFTILPLSIAHTLAVSELPFHHRDPFDRMIAVQSAYEKLPVLSSDTAFDQYGIQRLW